MKTPRYLLFERHRAIESKLDAIRESALAEMTHAKPQSREEKVSVPLAFFASLREVFRSLRWHLAGMSAVWLLAILLNIDQSSTSTITVAKENAPSPQQLVMALRENRRQIAELTAPPDNVSEPILSPQSFIWPRRNEFPSPTEMA